jgi:hypothetical protein
MQQLRVHCWIQENVRSPELHHPFLDLVFPRQGTAILLSFRRVICPKSVQAFPNIAQEVVAAQRQYLYLLLIPGFSSDLFPLVSGTEKVGCRVQSVI